MFAPAEMWELNFQGEVHPNGLTLILLLNDVSQSGISEIAVTVTKIEREKYCKIDGLPQL